MVSMVDPITINLETKRIDYEYSLEKDLIELIFLNPSKELYLTLN